MRTLFRCLLSGLLLFFLLPARAEVGVLLSEPMGKGFSQLTEAGHASIYLSNVCPESPVRVRLCRPGEQGSVISNYENLAENRPYEWNIIPLSIFLYGVDRPESAPLMATVQMKSVLEDRYLQERLSEICVSDFCRYDRRAQWRNMVASTFLRTIYLFQVKTTPLQDMVLIQHLNQSPNVNHYNGFRWNCADFSMHLLSFYFPHAARRDFLNDFFMTSPKAVAKSLGRYARKHPELDYSVIRYTQVPSAIHASGPARQGTDAMLHQKKWVIPLFWFRAYSVPAVMAGYALTGRFNPEKELAEHGPPDSASMDKAELRQSREKLRELTAEARRDGRIQKDRDLLRLLERVEQESTSYRDESGKLWMKVSGKSGAATVGLTRENLFAEDSDLSMAYGLMLARMYRELRLPADHREPSMEMKRNWSLLSQLKQEQEIVLHRPAAVQEKGN